MKTLVTEMPRDESAGHGEPRAHIEQVGRIGIVEMLQRFRRPGGRARYLRINILAGLVIKTAKKSGRACEVSIRELTTSRMDTNDAVCLVLILRFYKRLMAHMSNISTTVVMPVDLIDFYDEPES